VCKADLTSLGTGNLVTPFWQRLGQFFIYPAYPGPLLFVVILTAISYALANIPIPLFSRLSLFIVGIVFVKYAYVVLEDTAHGHLLPRSITNEVLTEQIILPLKQIALMFALGAVLSTIFDIFGNGVFWVALAITLFALPASTMVLAMEHRFFSAFNPILVGSVIQRIGLPYFILVLLLYFLSLASESLLGMLSGVISPSAMIALFFFATMYFTLIMFNMMGYVLYQYHEQLGFTVEVEADTPQDKDAEPMTSPDLRAVEIMLQEGKNAEAAQRLTEIIQDAPGNIDARERMLKLARLNADNALHTRQGQDYISYLFHENKLGLATKVYQDCVAFDKQFRPVKPNERVEIAKLLRNNGHHRTAVTLLSNLHRDFPTFDGTPAAYMLVAQLLCEQFGEDDKAKQILQYVLKNYPHHTLVNEIQTYLGVVEKLGAKGKAV
jgi:tetratricopeptide (TPR) repeat protein